MKRNKKLFQFYASSLTNENDSSGSPTSPTRTSEVSSTDSNRMSSQRYLTCVSPPIISCSNHGHINPTNSPLSNNNIITNFPYNTPTTITTTTTNISPLVNTTTININHSIPRPTHLSKLSPPSPQQSTNLHKSIPTNFPKYPTYSNLNVSSYNHNRDNIPNQNMENKHHNPNDQQLFKRLWDHLDSSKSQVIRLEKIQKQNKMNVVTTTRTRRTRISISELLC